MTSYGRGGNSRGVAKMRMVIKASTDRLKYTVTEKNISYAFNGEAMQNIRYGYIQYVNSMAQAESGGIGFKEFAHLYELGHEGEDGYRLFNVIANKMAKRPSLNIYVKRATMETPLTDWQKDAQSKSGSMFSRHTFYNRPQIVESGGSVTISPTKSHGSLIPGEQDNPRYAGMPIKFFRPIHINYSDEQYKGHGALKRSMIEFSNLYMRKIVSSWGKKYVKSNIRKAIAEARAASTSV